MHLVARLRAGGFRCSTRSSSPTICKTFGAVEVSRRAYHKLLEAALVGEADFTAFAGTMSGAEALAAAQR